MKFKHCNQNNYANVPYPSPSAPKATVKSSGCGVCSIVMIVENLTGKSFPAPEMAAYAIKNGARVNGGTDMARLAKCVERDFGIRHSTTSDEAALIKHLRGGGMAIANVGGDRSGYVGVFSNGGHYVVVAGLKGDRPIILDPGYYAGKFTKAGRRGKVEVGANNELYCSPSVLDADTKNRTPNYYLFFKPTKKEDEEMTQERFNEMMNAWLSSRAKKAPQEWSAGARAWAEANGLIKGDENGYRYQSFVTREELVAMLYRFWKM